MCEKPAVPQNSFMCFNHGFTDAGNVCNGRQDCVDGSDEINCGSSNILFYVWFFIVPVNLSVLSLPRYLLVLSGV